MKYVGKAEARSTSYKDMLRQTLPRVNSRAPLLSLTFKLLNKLVGERDWSDIQVEIEKDIKERFQHKLRSLTTEKDSFTEWCADILNDALLHSYRRRNLRTKKCATFFLGIPSRRELDKS